eukprot:s805_g12.t1
MSWCCLRYPISIALFGPICREKVRQNKSGTNPAKCHSHVHTTRAMMQTEEIAQEEAEEECELGLDEFGWDPMVDDYLEALVEEAQDEESQVDWAWISCQFFETLEPTQDQIHAALERFSPGSLQERWSYLQNKKTLAQVTTASEPPRDRVLEAMQNFLFGLPTPNMNPERHKAMAETKHKEESEGRTSPGLQEETPQDPANVAGCRLQCCDEEPSAGLVTDSIQDNVIDENCRVDHEATSALAGGSSQTMHGHRAAAKGTDALRRCLEELRWHGEALRQCAAGANAQQLCAEASVRRKELLWSLGGEQEIECSGAVPVLIPGCLCAVLVLVPGSFREVPSGVGSGLVPGAVPVVVPARLREVPESKMLKLCYVSWLTSSGADTSTTGSSSGTRTPEHWPEPCSGHPMI